MNLKKKKKEPMLERERCKENGEQGKEAETLKQYIEGGIQWKRDKQ